MDLIGMLRALRRRWAYVLGGVSLGVLAAAAVVASSTPTYTGTAQVFISTPAPDATASDLAQGSQFSQQRVTTYARLANTPLVLQPVLDRLDLDMSVGDLAGKVSAAAPVNTSLVSVTAEDGDRETAALITNAVADSLVQVIPRLEQASDGSPAPVRATVVEPAQPPGSPASPNVRLLLALGLIVGLAVGVGAAVLRERTDTVVRDRRAIARVSAAPLLGSIPVDAKRASRSANSTRPRLEVPTAEAFRKLRTTLSLDPDRRAVVVTSSVPGEGKTMVAVQLAKMVATAGARVLFVDADLRGGAEDREVDTGGGGLSTLLAGTAAFEDVVRPWTAVDSLDFLPAGAVPPNPSELLGSQRMVQFLAETRRLYDLVLIDAPPLLPVTDAAVLSRLADGVVVVVGRGRVDQDDLLEACTTLDAVRANPLGFVLNFAPRRPAQSSASRRTQNVATSPAEIAGEEGERHPEPASQSSRH